MTLALSHLEMIRNKKLVEVFRFSHNDVDILLDVKRVNYFEVNNVVSEVVDVLLGRLPAEVLSRHSDEAFTEAMSDLQENGFFDQDLPVDGEGDCAGAGHVVENLVVNVSHDCNLRCRYCFADTGHYKGRRELMDEATAKRTLDWFFRQAENKPHLNLHFFGGEPFMNVDLVAAMADYARVLEQAYGKKIYLNVCTNGTIINDRIIDLVKRHEMGLQISIDGPKDLHDAFRPYPRGMGSYDVILENLRRLFNEIPRDQIIARATIPHRAVYITEVVDHLFDIGFEKVFFVPAMGCGKAAVNGDDLADIRAQYDHLAETYIERRLQGQMYLVFPFAAEVQSVGSGEKKLYGCGAGLGFASVSVEGTIYPCMRFTDNQTYRLGDVSDGLIPAKRARLFARTVERRPSCLKCWARYLCGGACIAVSAEKRREIEEADPIGCEVAQHIARLAMYVNARLSAVGIETSECDDSKFDFLRRRFS